MPGFRRVPVLLEHFQKSYPPKIREGIGRALATPDARGAWTTLLRLFKAEREEYAKDGLAVALSAIADDDVLDDVIELVRDPSHGECRIFFLGFLGKSRLPAARAALMEAGSDPQLMKEAKVVLARKNRRSKRARK